MAELTNIAVSAGFMGVLGLLPAKGPSVCQGAAMRLMLAGLLSRAFMGFADWEGGMLTILLASAVIMLVLCGWILVQQLARSFALRHPEFGPYRERGGCGGDCACSGDDSCQRKLRVNRR